MLPMVCGGKTAENDVYLWRAQFIMVKHGRVTTWKLDGTATALVPGSRWLTPMQTGSSGRLSLRPTWPRRSIGFARLALQSLAIFGALIDFLEAENPKHGKMQPRFVAAQSPRIL